MNESSPSGIGSSPSGIAAPGSATIAGRTRLQTAKQVGLLLRRAFDSARSYKISHSFAKEARSRVITQVMQLIAEHGELQLELTARALLHDNVAIEEARSHAESMTLALFREGARRITFLPTLTEAELSFLLEAWIEAFLDPLRSEGITTRLWEKEAKGISLVVIDTFEAGDDAVMEAGGGDVAPRAALTVRDQIDAIVSAIASESLGGAGDAIGGGVVSISAEDAALLRSDMVRAVTAEQLASQDVSGEQLEPLSPHESSTLSAALSDNRDGPVARFLATLVNAGLLGTDAQRDQVVSTFERLVVSLADEHRFEEPFALYKQLVDLVPKDTTMGNLRVALLKRFRNALMGPTFVDRLVAGLDAAETAESALTALKVLGRTGAQLVSERLSRLTTQEGRQRATELLASFEAVGVSTVDLKTTEPLVLIEFLKKIGTLREADAVQLMDKTLHATDVSVRRAAVAHLTAALAVRLPMKLLMSRLGDSDQDVRLNMIRLVTTLENPAAVPTLAASLRRPMDSEERAAIYKALVTIGGPKARDALLGELASNADIDARVAAAQALRGFREPAVAAALQALASKVLVNAKLRAACRDVLQTFRI